MTTPRWHTREDSGLHLDAQLRWWHDEELIEHPNIVEAFSKGISFDDHGRPTLVFGKDWCYFTFERCLFAVVAVDLSGEARLSIRLSDRTAEWLEASSLTLDSDGALLVRVKTQKAWAKFSRSAQVQLGQYLEHTESGWALKVADHVTLLPNLVVLDAG